MKPKITVLAITLNDEKSIKQYVQSLSFADEIIFIDSNSTDATISIAKELGVKIIQSKFNDFSKQQTLAIQQAKNDWIVLLHLEETITPKLIEEIIAVTASQDKITAFYIKSNFYFMGKEIKYGGWKPKKSIRVFNKQFCNTNENLIPNTIETNGKTAILKENSNHYDYKSFDQYNERLNLISKLEATELYQKKVRPNGYHFFVRPVSFFIWRYVVRLGFLDGKEGFILSYIHSFAVFKRYLQLWLMYRKME